VNTLKRKQEAQEQAQKVEERRVKAAEKQLVKELGVVNKVARKSSKEKAVYTRTKAKTIALTMLKQHKVSTPARPRHKAPIKTIMVEQLQEHAKGGVIRSAAASFTGSVHPEKVFF
jgi:hypothetical protein